MTDDDNDNGLVIFIDNDGVSADYEVWCGVDTITAHNANVRNAHVIGAGATREEAVRMAVAHLEAALELLQSPPGIVPEIDIRPHGQEPAHVD